MKSVWGSDRQRQLGTGFGPDKHFVINRERMSQYRGHFLSRGMVSGAISSHDLAQHLSDILLDMNITRIADKLLPAIFDGLERHRSLFMEGALFARLSPRFINSIQESFPLIAGTANLQVILSSLFDKKEEILTKEDKTFLAYVIPALIEEMSHESILQMISLWHAVLEERDYRLLRDPHYFDVRFHFASDDQLILANNGRALRFNTKDSESRLYFRGKEWILDHSHFHFERDGEEREYVFSDSEATQVGELHTIFRRLSKNGNTKFVAVGVPVMLGEENSSIAALLSMDEVVDQATPVDLENPLQLREKVNFQATFLGGLGQAPLSAGEYVYHSWASAISQTPAFKAGLRFVIIPKPVELSPEQYERLHELFGTLTPLTADKALEPIPRIDLRTGPGF